MKQWVRNLVIGTLLATGLACLFYPSVSNWYNTTYQVHAITGYSQAIQTLPPDALQQQLNAAAQYNASLTGMNLEDPFIPGSGAALPAGYLSILNAGGGIMGSIQIPKIDVNLPIYHGTAKNVLEKGAGHMDRTAFPVGGVGNHAVLTGHTALPGAVLFSNLDKLEMGDTFYIEIFGATLAYQVDDITVVAPDETDTLRPVAGKDYVTLLTCTPYGINTHRLLVRGSRIPYDPQAPIDAPASVVAVRYDLIIALVVLLLVVAVAVAHIVRGCRRKRKKSRRTP